MPVNSIISTMKSSSLLLKKIIEFGLRTCGISKFHYFQILVYDDLVWYPVLGQSLPCNHDNLVLAKNCFFSGKSMHDMNCIVSLLGKLIVDCFLEETPFV